MALPGLPRWGLPRWGAICQRANPYLRINRPVAGKAARLVTGLPGSALAGRDSHPLDDYSDFQKASPSLLPVRPGFPDRYPDRFLPFSSQALLIRLRVSMFYVAQSPQHMHLDLQKGVALMTIYEDELEQLKSLGNRIARFRRVAIHCHTPLSHDWSRAKGDPLLNQRNQYLATEGERKFLDAIRSSSNSELDVFIPTDHMKCAYAARLVEARTANCPVVLPGMEVCLRTTEAMGNVKIHVLVLLPVGSTQETFSALLPGIREERLRNGKEDFQPSNLHEWIETIHLAKGLCIAAHIESNRGIRKCFRQTAEHVLGLVSENASEQEEEQKQVDGALKNLLLGIGFDALEIQRPDAGHHYHWVDASGTPHRLPTVLGLDAHSIEEYKQPDKITLIKMTCPESRGLTCIRYAMIFADTRIRFPTDLPIPPSPRVIGVVIKGTDGTTFFPDLIVPFSENLNCIIGPRGAGKSTLVEAIRYVFGYNRTIETELGKELATRVRSLQQATLCGATIRVYYHTANDEVLLLQATYDPREDYATRVLRPDGSDTQIQDVELCGQFPLRLYGWSEIELIGREGWKQRTALDRMIPDVVPNLILRDGLRRELSYKCVEIRQCASALDKLLAEEKGALRRWAEHKTDFEKYNTPQVDTLFQSLDIASLQQRVITQVASNTLGLATTLQSLIPINLSTDINQQLEEHSALREWWNNGIFDKIDLPTVESQVALAIRQALKPLLALHGDLNRVNADIAATIEKLDADLRICVSVDAKQENMASLRQNAKKRFDTASVIRRNYLKKWRELLLHIAGHQKIVHKLELTQATLGNVRRVALTAIEKRLNWFFTQGVNIAVSLKEGCDRKDFREKLNDFIKDTGLRNDRKWREVLSAHYTPPQLSKALLSKRNKTVSHKTARADDGQCFTLTANDALALEQKAAWAEKDNGANVYVLTNGARALLSILELSQIPWDDEVSISLNGKPVVSCSPGQRSSAMLPLIMLAEKSPLVIDQPEDNLDNRLVGGILAGILAERKEQRQIITCTHSPNIVVLGDAEQVIPLDPESDSKGRIGPSPCGSIDNEDIIRTIVLTMEGGEAAFKARSARYGL